MTFRVGQKVVCVDASATNHGYWNPPTEGEIYTIAGFAEPSWIDGAPVVCLREIKNPHKADGRDFGYWARRFRPVVEDADKLEWARKLVAPNAKERELVE